MRRKGWLRVSDDLSAFREELRRRGRVGVRKLTRRANQQQFVAETIGAAQSALAQLSRHELDAVVECPTRRVYNGTSCRDACRCGGVGSVTVGALVARYTTLLAFLEAR